MAVTGGTRDFQNARGQALVDCTTTAQTPLPTAFSLAASLRASSGERTEWPLPAPYYGGGQRGWSPRCLTCIDAKMTSPYLTAPVITPAGMDMPAGAVRHVPVKAALLLVS
jgi:hypothetical protein